MNKSMIDNHWNILLTPGSVILPEALLHWLAYWITKIIKYDCSWWLSLEHTKAHMYILNINDCISEPKCGVFLYKTIYKICLHSTLRLLIAVNQSLSQFGDHWGIVSSKSTQLYIEWIDIFVILLLLYINNISNAIPHVMCIFFRIQFPQTT